jgi:5-formyltetrahydrofolate cyclo-ligase
MSWSISDGKGGRNNAEALESLGFSANGGKKHFSCPSFSGDPMLPQPDSPPPGKEALRRSMRERLRAIRPEQMQAWSHAIRSHLMQHPQWASPGTVVALFGGLASEPDLRPLLPWLAERRVTAAFFALEADAMVPYLVRDRQDLIPGQLGIWEPVRAPERRVEVSALKAVLVPGLAFSARDGSRLGRGKGYYDRTLASADAACRRIGVCFACQMRETVPHEPHDVPVQAIVTERGWQEIHQNSSAIPVVSRD